MRIREDMMRRYLKILLVSVSFLAVTACASKPPVPPPQPQCGYEPDAIQIYLKADSKLNLFEGSSHTLHFCIYQLQDPNSFNQLAQDKKGLRKLLECDRFDPSFTNAKEVVVQPGSEESLSLARAEGTNYVGVFAGYYLLDSLETRKLVRLFEIPVIVEKKGWIKKTKTTRCGKLNIHLFLGPDGIQEFERKQ
jgi:type VI secretion system VasD/TssJ family lipoprotein